MYATFRLSMPKVNTWNGKWSGEGKNFTVVRKVPNRDLIGTFTYDFPDGWVAQITVTEGSEKGESAGFCGYDWMVDSLIKHGKIK